MFLGLAILLVASCRWNDGFATNHPARVTGSGASSTQIAGVTFDDVLRLAVSNTTHAKRQIQEASHRADDQATRALAERILALWEEDKNTFFSATPLLLDSTCIDFEQLRDLYSGKIDTTVLYLRVHVTADGRVTRVLVQNTSVNPTLAAAVTEVVRRKRLLPAKPGNDYVDSDVNLACRIDVR